ncbi:MAG: hypothetical protein WBD79_05705, partial [Anaerolineae bacterium]
LVQQLIKFLATTHEDQILLWQAARHARPDLLVAPFDGLDAAGTQSPSRTEGSRSRGADAETASVQIDSLAHSPVFDTQDPPTAPRTVVTIFRTSNIYVLMGTPIVLLLLAWLGTRLFYQPPVRNGLIGIVRSAEGAYLTVEADGRHINNGDSIPLGAVVTVTFEIRNDDIYSATILELTAGARGPGGHTLGWNAPDRSFENRRHIVLKPGESYLYHSVRTFDEAGDYFVEAVMRDPQGKWGGIRPFYRVKFFVAESP